LIGVVGDVKRCAVMKLMDVSQQAGSFKMQLNTSGNLDYYLGGTGAEIMSVGNFNDGVMSLLRIESAFLSKILAERSHDALLEMGCDQAGSYDVAQLHGVKYVGVDIRTQVIDELLQLAASEGKYANAIFMRDDLLNIGDIRAKVGRGCRALCLLPFNLIGNLGALDEFFRAYASADMDLLISSWQCSTAALVARSDYYENCGIDGLKVIENESSQCFVSSAFRSDAYAKKYLHGVARRHGFVLVDEFDTSLTQLMYFCRPST
jgi:hypothetical protein